MHLLNSTILYDLLPDFVNIYLPALNKSHLLQIAPVKVTSAFRDKTLDAALHEESRIVLKEEARHLEIAVVWDDVIEFYLCSITFHLGDEQSRWDHITQDKKA